MAAYIEALTRAVMDKCHITYEDEDVQRRLEEIVPDCMAQLRLLIGIGNDSDPFQSPGIERSLLLNFCWYEWNDAAEDFLNEYAPDIETARQKWRRAAYVEEQQAAD